MYIYKKYLVVLDICCQQLKDECKSEGFCVRFGHTVWKCTFIKMHICIGYMLPTIWGVYVSGKYMLIYHANTWGMTVNWRVSVCPSGTGFGMYIYEKIYLY